MIFNKINIPFFIVFLLFPTFFLSQKETALEKYIQEGIQSNLAIQQKNISLENAILSLKEAKSYFLPSADFQAIYTTAKGGRSYEIPVGDYLNPIFNTVNSFLGQSFLSPIENEKINFLPKNYYDAHLRISMPILNTDIFNNNRIKQKQLTLTELEVEIYARELVKEIKTTYYGYAQLKKAIQILQFSIDLASESKRTNEKLLEAGKGVYAYVLRSETEIAQGNARLNAITLEAQTVKQYFNALLNRSADAEIEIDENLEITDFSVPHEKPNSEKREEWQTLKQAADLHSDLIKMKKQAFVPKLNGFADFGSQAENMDFNREALYYMVGLQLEFPIFNGNRNRMNIQKAENDLTSFQLKSKEIKQKLDLAVTKAYHDVLAEQSNYNAAQKQLEMAETYFRLIHKGYNEGINSYLETVDARTQLSSAKLAVNVSHYDLLAALARLERETATYPLQLND